MPGIGIRVNALCPGPLRTELLMSFLNTEAKSSAFVHLRWGASRGAGDRAAALSSPRTNSSYVTGTEFLVDGGLTAAYVTPE